MRWRERLAALDEAELQRALERQQHDGEPPIQATLLALLEQLDGVPLPALARELGIERALLLRAATDLDLRGKLVLTGETPAVHRQVQC
ncbi:hypothetical protein GCM10027040_33630 [Halomonas shantousis]